MLSVLLASVLVQQSAPEPRLEWSTFGDFAAKQFEGSEYRLVMDRAIGERPMVYYFSYPGTDKLALLRRTCKELCLNFDIDDKYKRIFISGPNSDAGMTLKMRVQLGVQKTQEIARKYWSTSPEQLELESEMLVQRALKEKSEKLRSELQFQRDVLIALMRAESRAVMACLLTADPANLASRITTKFLGEGAIPVTREAIKIFEAGYSDLLLSDPVEVMYWQDLKKLYDEMVAEDAVPVMIHSVAKNGAVSFSLRLDSKSKSEHMGTVSISELDWLNDAEDIAKDAVPEALASERFEPKQTIFWGVDGMNSFQTLAIKHKWNTVAWLDTGRNHKDLTSTLRGFSMLKNVRVKLTDDGWMVPYILGQRWPAFSGNWRGVMKMDGKIAPETDIKLLREYLESLTSDEIDGMAQIKGESLDYRLESLISSARILRTALRISTETKLKEFEFKISQLSLDHGSEVSKYWPHSANAEMQAPAVRQRRGQATLAMIDREVQDPDFDDLPAFRTLIVILAVPNGTNGADGKLSYAVDRCEVILKKEK